MITKWVCRGSVYAVSQAFHLKLRNKTRKYEPNILQSFSAKFLERPHFGTYSHLFYTKMEIFEIDKRTG